MRELSWEIYQESSRFIGGDMSSLKQFVSQHPRLTAWLVLAIGMVAILAWSARDVGLLPGQWAALIVATIGLAGLCIWIIGWEDEDVDEDEGGEAEASDVEAPAGAEAGRPQ